MDNGYIKFHRKGFKHKFWTKARVFSEFEAWFDLLASARYDETETNEYIDGREIRYGRGQFPASIRFLAKRWNWGEQKVRSFINSLKKDKSITTSKDQGQTIITICRYATYNSLENAKNTANNTPSDTDISLLLKELQDMKAHLTTQQITQQQHSDNTKNKKDKKERKVINPPISPTEGWREDFDFYLEQLREAYTILLEDKDWIKQKQSYHPKLNIEKSLEKACVEFWATPAGWEYKKKSKTVVINWKSTFDNALNQKGNKVWKD